MIRSGIAPLNDLSGNIVNESSNANIFKYFAQVGNGVNPNNMSLMTHFV